MIKVAYVINYIAHTGPSNVLLDIIKQLDKSKYTPIIFTLKSELNSKIILLEMERQAVQVVSLFMKNLEMDLFTKKSSLKLLEKINEFKPDLIHTHGYQPVLLTSRISSYKSIATIHNVYQKDFILSKGYIIGNYMIKRYSSCLNKIENCIAVSETVRRLNPNRCSRVIYNGCNTEKFHPVDKEKKKNLREKLNLPISTNIYIVIGNLTKLKNPKLIVNTFNNLNKKHDDDKFLLLFLGEGTLLEECKVLSKQESFICFLGFKNNINEYIQAADYTISASKSEGFALNFIESTLCGVPVIASNIPPFKECYDMFPELKELMFIEGDSKDLEKKVELSLKQKYSMTVPSNRAFNLLSAKKMTEDYQNFYEKLI